MNFPARARSWSRSDWLALLGLTLLAALLRFAGLAQLPAGFHGDEAVTGLEAARILRDGSIGVYSPLALGQPAGPLYLSAWAVSLWGHEVWAARFVAALLGTLAVPLLYGFLRAHVNRETALLGAGLLALLGWHVHFSRVGFPIISWPLCAIVASWALFEALQRRDWRWFALAGAAAGLGIYSYNAHIVFLVALVGFLLVALAWQRETALQTRALWLSCFGATLLLVALPMLRFALDGANGYFGHGRTISVFGTPEWALQISLNNKISFLAARYLSYWPHLVWSPQFDGSDGTGVTPAVPLALAALTLLGAFFAIKRRQTVGLFAIWLMLVSPLPVVVTVGGMSRRTVLVAICVAILAAWGASELYRAIAARAGRRRVAMLLVASWCLWIGAVEVRNYFGIATRSWQMDWVFCRELRESIVWMNGLPPQTPVYFLSERWSFNYEPRVFLAPDRRGENRSFEFGNFDLNLDPRLQRPAAWVLLGKYRDQLAEIQRKHPGGRVTLGAPAQGDNGPSFIGYELK